MSNIDLTKLTELPLLPQEDIKDNSLMYIVVNGKSYRTYYGYIIEKLREASGSGLPLASEGDGLIYEGGEFVARPIDYSDIQNVPTPAPFNYNIDVTFTDDGQRVTVNPDALTQRYVVKNIEYSITNTFVFDIEELDNPENERIDLIIAQENGVIIKREGVESETAITPGINGNELILATVLRTEGGIVPEIPAEKEFSNALELSIDDEVTWGGDLDQNTTIDGVSSYTLSFLNLTTLNLQSSGVTTLLGNGDSGFTLGSQGGHIFEDADATGLKYDADYSANFTARSLVDKAYVDGILPTFIEGSIPFADNTGALAENNTTLHFDPSKDNLYLGMTDSDDVVTVGDRGDYTFNIKEGATAPVDSSPNTIKLYAANDAGSGVSSPFFMTPDGTAINTRRIWDDTLFNITVDNGLTHVEATSIKLGGALTGDTTISTGTNAFIIQDDRATELGIQYLGFGETNITTPGAVDYSTLDFNSLTPKKYVDDAIDTDIAALESQFTAGSVLFSDGTNFAEDNANFFWDNANDILHIGTNTNGGGSNNLVIANSTTPISGATDATIYYSKDFDGAGTASPFIHTEDAVDIDVKGIWEFVGSLSFQEGSIPYIGLGTGTRKILVESNNKLFFNADKFGVGTNTLGDGSDYLVIGESSAPSTGISGGVAIYTLDFDGAGTRSPYAMTEDSYQINIRRAEWIKKEFEFHPSLETSKITELEAGQEVKIVDYDTQAISSIAYETRTNDDIALNNTAWTSRADLSALNTYINGLTTGKKIQVRLTVTFTSAWNTANVVGYVNIEHLPKQ